MRYHVIILLLFYFAFVSAQDLHLSQYDVTGLHLNPATTGMFDRANKYRIVLDQRSQWGSLGIKPFLTSFASYDMPYKYGRNALGIGAFLINDNSGMGNYNKFTFMASVAYDIIGSSSRRYRVPRGELKHLLTTGLQVGVFYRSVNPARLHYDVQYSGSGFDPGLPSNEAFSAMNVTRFDANFGVYYKYLEAGKKYYPYAGVALYHITQPDESLTGATARLPMRTVGHGGVNIVLNDKVEVTPRILYMKQGGATELMPGVMLHYRLTEKGLKLLGGADMRLGDAAIVSLGLSDPKYALRISYDVNYSYLSTYTRGRGAFEISLVYTGERKQTAPQQGPPPKKQF